MNVVAKLYAHGVRGKAIADTLSVSKGAVSLWKSGKRQPRPVNQERLLALARIVGVDLSAQREAA